MNISPISLPTMPIRPGGDDHMINPGADDPGNNIGPDPANNMGPHVPHPNPNPGCLVPDR